MGRKIEHVVDQLVGHPEIAAEALQRLLLGRRAFGNDRAEAARRGEQRGGLGFDDVEIGSFGRIRVVGGDQLTDLALGNDRGGVRQDFEDA